jgi:hypothetical protein
MCARQHQVNGLLRIGRATTWGRATRPVATTTAGDRGHDVTDRVRRVRTRRGCRVAQVSGLSSYSHSGCPQWSGGCPVSVKLANFARSARTVLQAACKRTPTDWPTNRPARLPGRPMARRGGSLPGARETGARNDVATTSRERELAAGIPGQDRTRSSGSFRVWRLAGSRSRQAMLTCPSPDRCSLLDPITLLRL